LTWSRLAPVSAVAASSGEIPEPVHIELDHVRSVGDLFPRR
jgi:hypothetical protein